MNLDKVMAGLAQSGVTGGLAGGLAGGALSGALMSKKGRKHAKTLLQVGGVAALGGLAWKAYQGFRDQSRAEHAPAGQLAPQAPAGLEGPAQAPSPTGFSYAPAPRDAVARADWRRLDQTAFRIDPRQSHEGSRGLLVVRAMIAAASADGHLDPQEQARIFERVEALGLAPDEKALLFDELRRPLALSELVREVPDAEAALEVYAASVYAVDETRLAGRAYLDALASSLALPEALVSGVESELRGDATAVAIAAA